MTHSDMKKMRWLEGRRVSVSLDDGERIDDCQLVSVGRFGAPTLWLYVEGGDRFVPPSAVIDLREYIRRVA